MALDVKNTKQDQVKKRSKKSSGGFGRFFTFLKEVKAEIKRITWPTKEDVKKASIAVATFCLLYILFIGGVDVVFKNLFDMIAKLI